MTRAIWAWWRAGQAGMRAWNRDEVRLVTASQQARGERQRQEDLRRVEQKKIEQEQEIARKEREQLVLRNNRTLRISLAGAIGLLVVIGFLGLFWYQERNSARAAEAGEKTQKLAAETALNRRLIAESKHWANLAQDQLNVDPVASIQLSLQALLPSQAITRPYVPEAEFALAQALHTSQERQYLSTTMTSKLQIDFHANQIAVGGASLQVVDDNLKPMMTLQGYKAPIEGVQWANDGQLLGYDKTTVYVWQGQQLIAQRTFTDTNPDPFADTGAIKCADWHPQRREVALCVNHSVMIWSPMSDQLVIVPNSLDYSDAPIDAIDMRHPGHRTDAGWRPGVLNSWSGIAKHPQAKPLNWLKVRILATMSPLLFGQRTAKCWLALGSMQPRLPLVGGSTGKNYRLDRPIWTRCARGPLHALLQGSIRNHWRFGTESATPIAGTGGAQAPQQTQENLYNSGEANGKEPTEPALETPALVLVEGPLLETPLVLHGYRSDETIFRCTLVGCSAAFDFQPS